MVVVVVVLVVVLVVVVLVVVVVGVVVVIVVFVVGLGFHVFKQKSLAYRLGFFEEKVTFRIPNFGALAWMKKNSSITQTFKSRTVPEEKQARRLVNQQLETV